MTSTALAHLRDVATAVAEGEPPEVVTRTAADAVARAAGRGLAFAFVEGAPIAGSQDGAAADLSSIAHHASYGRMPYDPANVPVPHRGRWAEPLKGLISRDSHAASPIGRVYAAHGVRELGRVLVCEGARFVGIVGVALPREETDFGDADRDVLVPLTEALAPCLRLAAVSFRARAHGDALEHLMAERADAAVLVSSSGVALARSAAAARLFQRWPSLLERALDLARGTRARVTTAIDPRSGVELTATPCAPRGHAAAVLVVLGEPAADPGLARRRVSARQAEFLDLLEQGLTNRELASAMGLEENTVKTMLQRLYRRAGASGRVELLRFKRRGFF